MILMNKGNSDMYGEEYIKQQIDKYDQNIASEGKFYRYIALFFALIGLLFLIFGSGIVSILFFGVGIIIFLTSFVHGDSSRMYFEAGYLADGRSCCPKCGSTEKFVTPPPMKQPAPSGKKVHFGTSPEEQYQRMIRNEYGICSTCGTQYYEIRK